MCGSIVDIRCATTENRQGKKKDRKKKKKKEERRNHRWKHNGLPFHRAAIIVSE